MDGDDDGNEANPQPNSQRIPKKNPILRMNTGDGDPAMDSPEPFPMEPHEGCPLYPLRLVDQAGTPSPGTFCLPARPDTAGTDAQRQAPDDQDAQASPPDGSRADEPTTIVFEEWLPPDWEEEPHPR